MKKFIYFISMFVIANFGFSQVGIGTEEPNPSAILDLVAQDKGLLLPRLTLAQRDAINNPPAGLTVYNTDGNCVQNWDGTKWSECDAISLARFTFNCSASTLKDKYYEGVPVSVYDLIELNATVDKSGTYSFYTEPVNGVRYAFTSIVSQAGTTPIKIQIPAYGEPELQGTYNYKLYDQTGREVCPNTFTANVIENNADFTIICSSIQTMGTFYENQQVNSVTNGVSIPLDVNTSGFYNLHTDTVNGMWFEGAGQVITGSTRVTLSAKGLPLWKAPDGVLTFKIYDKNGTDLGCSFTVQLQSTAATYSSNCNTSNCVFNGTLVNTKPAAENCYISLTLNVTKPGPWKIISNTVQGITYSNIGTFDAIGTQTVKLYASGTAGTQGSYSIQLLDAANKNAVICTPANQMVIQPNQGVVECPATVPVLDFGWQTNTSVGATASIPFNVTATGPIALTAQANGVTLSYSGNLASIGTTNLIFSASGKPTAGNPTNGIQFDFKDATGQIVCSRFIKVTYTLGMDKSVPGFTCKDIRTANGGVNAPDGEYWINPVSTVNSTNTFKTFCDMTNGGLTLIWSYSEKTAKNTYWNNGIPGNPYGLYYDKQINNNNYADGVVNYENFRISKAAMQEIAVRNGTNSAATVGFIRFRVVSSLSNAQNTTDEFALNNYMDVTPNYPYIPFNANEGWYVTKGKLFGKALQFVNNSGTYDGHNIAGTYYVISNGADRWYVSNNFSTTNTTLRPNLFGGFGGSTELGGHFLECTGGITSCPSSQLIVSPNNRVMQLFYY